MLYSDIGRPVPPVTATRHDTTRQGTTGHDATGHVQTLIAACDGRVQQTRLTKNVVAKQRDDPLDGTTANHEQLRHTTQRDLLQRSQRVLSHARVRRLGTHHAHQDLRRRETARGHEQRQ